MLWDFPACIRSRTAFLQKIQMEIAGSFDALDGLGNVFILENELWEENLASHLGLVKEFIVDIWEERYMAIVSAKNSPVLSLWRGCCWGCAVTR